MSDRKKTRFKICISCESSLELDHEGIRCVEDHNICSNCSRHFSNVIFDEPLFNIPPKCPECKQAIVIKTFERQLSEKKLEKFRKLMENYEENKRRKNEDDPKNRPKHTTKETSANREGVWAQANDQDYKLKCKIDKAIENGSIQACPKCKIRGRKDGYSCTHVSCPKCKTRFCYICGLAEDSCNKKFGFYDRDIYDHNRDWETNKSRCPRRLYNISEVDAKWPLDRNEKNALDFFHRTRIIRNLKELVNHEGIEKIRSFERNYGYIAKSGFSLNEIIIADTEIINRKNGLYKSSIACNIL